ncbi:MAG TPA: alpha-E domain-containing protein [Solirubrobacteraceae bacterium]
MLARIAQELFWLGRDLTRAEHTARILDGAFHADVAGGPGERGVALSWEGVLATIGAKPPALGEEGHAVDEDAPPAPAAPTRVQVARLLTLDTDNPASVVSCVARARERGRTLRDVISTEMWEALNSFYLLLGRYDLQAALQSGPYSFYQEVKEHCALFWGLLDRTLLRDEGRAFLEAGGRIDEADMILRMLRVAIPAGPLEDGHETEALALLHAVGGFQAYRRAVRVAPTVGPVIRFLLFDSAYPGSVASSVEALSAALTAADSQPRSSPPVLRLGRLIADLELQRRAPDEGGALELILERVQDELELVDRDIDTRYFAIAALAAVHV